MSWKMTLPCTRHEAERLDEDLSAFVELDPLPVLVTSEIDEARDAWRVDAYFESAPDAATIASLVALIPSANAAHAQVERIADEDWVTVSQQGIEPVRAGRFFVHTGTNADRIPDDATAFRIDAGLAFGTGTHETTAGCLAALDRLKRSGRRYDAIADIGTGTGLLAFAALSLWPRAYALASDIDPVSIDVTRENAAFNGVAVGHGTGALTLVVASGTDHPEIAARAPYDLLIANILAGPLIELAPAFAAVSAPGGTLILAGLLDHQARRVAATYRRHGYRLDRQIDNGAWPTLMLTMRQRLGWRRPSRGSGGTTQPPGDFGTW
ncbi:50S ribosomal protein L11 methyltransferase [Sphingorhabdus soli]|uniref:Ribosomal protein L11 methyltransferase n=2 Tax=Flavisphingopyxis soli TaxID=2601267 RepID=A0A5C6U797_9SPHN|nr:50S ribosomal protein L11 methyltransferase [Sphingorhabdus soli]